MNTFRFYVWPSFLAATVLSLPFAAAVVFVSMTSITPPRTFVAWLSVFGFAALVDIIVSVLPFVFYLLARVSWREKERIVREHLFGWPVALGIVCFAMAVVATAVVGDLNLFWSLVYFALSASVVASGLLASRIWLRLSYS